jgi:hypothetical protein
MRMLTAGTYRIAPPRVPNQRRSGSTEEVLQSQAKVSWKLTRPIPPSELGRAPLACPDELSPPCVRWSRFTS